MHRVDHICHAIVLDPGEANKFDSAKYCMHGIGMFPCAAFGLRLGLLLRVWDHTGGKRTAVLRMLCDLGEAAWKERACGGATWREE
jgi:hypothetical protein